MCRVSIESASGPPHSGYSLQGRGPLPVRRAVSSDFTTAEGERDSGFGLSGRAGAAGGRGPCRGLGQRGEPGGHGRLGAGQSSAHRLTCQQREDASCLKGFNTSMEQEVVPSKKTVQTDDAGQLMSECQKYGVCFSLTDLRLSPSAPRCDWWSSWRCRSSSLSRCSAPSCT